MDLYEPMQDRQSVAERIANFTAREGQFAAAR